MINALIEAESKRSDGGREVVDRRVEQIPKVRCVREGGSDQHFD